MQRLLDRPSVQSPVEERAEPCPQEAAVNAALPPLPEATYERAIQAIVEALGSENYAYLEQKAQENGAIAPSLEEVFPEILNMAESSEAATIRRIGTLFSEIRDFTVRLGLPRMMSPAPPATEVCAETGESIEMLRQSLLQDFRELEEKLPAIQAISDQISLIKATSCAEETIAIDPSHNAQSPENFENGDTAQKTAPAVGKGRGGWLRGISLKIPLQWLGRLLRISDRDANDENAEESRRQRSSQGKESASSWSFRRLFSFDIDGLRERAEHAVGLLSPRGFKSRYAQVGDDDEGGTGNAGGAKVKDALLKFVLDFGKIKGVKSGRSDCFEALLERYGTKVYSLAWRLTRNTEDAEEVHQDVFVTLYRKGCAFEGKSAFSSWIYRITVNAALMKLRKRRQCRSQSLEETIPNYQDSEVLKGAESQQADNLVSRNELHEALESAIGRLPMEYRPVFVLRDIDGLSTLEVGKILNLSTAAVKSRLHRSRLMLRRKLAPVYRQYQESDCKSAVGE